jgi:hypothetical protein
MANILDVNIYYLMQFTFYVPKYNIKIMLINK